MSDPNESLGNLAFALPEDVSSLFDAIDGSEGLFPAPPATDAHPDSAEAKAVAKGNVVAMPPLPPVPATIVQKGGKNKGKDKVDKDSIFSKMVCFEGTDNPKPLLRNVIVALDCSKEWFNTLAWDDFGKTIVTKRILPWAHPVGNQWTDYDNIKLTSWLQGVKLHIGVQTAADAVVAVAHDRTFHPVHEYLKGLKWDGTSRLDEWLTRYMGAEDKPIVREFGAKWLISAVARVFQPGCQADHTLLLEGPQGSRKSSALRILAGDAWFTDHISDLHDKDSRIDLQGKWIVELSELHAIRGKAIESVKAFLTTRVDKFRPPHARYTMTYPRQCVFAATTNDATPFTDETGNRRFWPVRCETILTEELGRDRDQLWAEAYERYLKGEPWWLVTPEMVKAAEKEQRARYDIGVWDELILEWCQNPTSGGPLDMLVEPRPLLSVPGCVSVSEVVEHALHGLPGELKRPDLAVAKCLKANGWRLHQHGGILRGKNLWQRISGPCERDLTPSE